MRITTFLRRAGLTRRQFALKAGVGYATVYRAHAGEPIKRRKVAEKISKATRRKVSVTELERGFA